MEWREAVDVYGAILPIPEDVVTGAHERWLFSTLFVGAKRVLKAAGSTAQAEAEQAKSVTDEEDDEPISGVRTREEVLSTSLVPRKRTQSGG
jgi:hypothetical protein